MPRWIGFAIRISPALRWRLTMRLSVRLKHQILGAENGSFALSVWMGAIRLSRDWICSRLDLASTSLRITSISLPRDSILTAGSPRQHSSWRHVERHREKPTVPMLPQPPWSHREGSPRLAATDSLVACFRGLGLGGVRIRAFYGQDTFWCSGQRPYHKEGEVVL